MTYSSVSVFIRKYLAYQRISVAVDTGRCHTYKNITCFQFFSCDHVFAVYHTNSKILPDHTRLPDKIPAFRQSLHRSVQLLTDGILLPHRLRSLRSFPVHFFRMQYNQGKIMVHRLHRQYRLHTLPHNRFQWYHACPVRNAIFNFVPTPSVPETNVGSSIPINFFMENAPENPPISVKYFRSHGPKRCVLSSKKLLCILLQYLRLLSCNPFLTPSRAKILRIVLVFAVYASKLLLL